MVSKVRYEFIGDGLGIPGMPHVITEQDVILMGWEKRMKNLVEAKKYEKVGEEEPIKEGD